MGVGVFLFFIFDKIVPNLKKSSAKVYPILILRKGDLITESEKSSSEKI